MKKIIIFAVVFITALTFGSCKKANPDVIGVGYIWWSSPDKAYCVRVGAEAYPINTVILPDGKWNKFVETQDLSSLQGSKVTIFTSQKHTGSQAILGTQTEEDIVALYRRRLGRIFGLLAIVFGSIGMLGGISVLIMLR